MPKLKTHRGAAKRFNKTNELKASAMLAKSESGDLDYKLVKLVETAEELKESGAERLAAQPQDVLELFS